MGGKGSKPEGARHAWAPRSLPRGVLPPDYVELRHPDGSVVHVVGVDYGSREGTVAARKVVRAANPDQTLLELCDDRVLPVWEILEHGGVSDSGKVSRPLPPLDTDSLQNDARLRKPGWWWLGGPYDAAFGAVVGTCSSSAQAACALESARLGAHTHLIDRKQSVTALRCFVGLLEVSRTGFVMPFQDLRVKADAALASATSASTADELQSARNDARAVLTAATAALMDGDAGGALEAVVRRTVVDERDQIFAHRCFEAAATLGAGGVIVAVVGKEHLPGIRAHWSKTEPDHVLELLQPRDFKDTFLAVGPLAGGGLVGSIAAYNVLPVIPRRIFSTALWLAPLTGAIYGTVGLVQRYDLARTLEAKFKYL